jgi:hypothetical protein
MLTQAKTTHRLRRPIPDDCSVRYAEGWAYADGVVAGGGHLNDAPPSEWQDDEKITGFQERMHLEREAQ